MLVVADLGAGAVQRFCRSAGEGVRGLPLRCHCCQASGQFRAAFVGAAALPGTVQRRVLSLQSLCARRPIGAQLPLSPANLPRESEQTWQVCAGFQAQKNRALARCSEVDAGTASGEMSACSGHQDPKFAHDAGVALGQKPQLALLAGDFACSAPLVQACHQALLCRRSGRQCGNPRSHVVRREKRAVHGALGSGCRGLCRSRIRREDSVVGQGVHFQSFNQQHQKDAMGR